MPALGALYLRCVGRPADIYRYLNRCIRTNQAASADWGWHITHLDQLMNC